MKFDIVVNDGGNWDVDYSTIPKFMDHSWQLNRLGSFNYKKITEIPTGSKYFVYLRVYDDFYDIKNGWSPIYSWCIDKGFSPTEKNFLMPERVWNDSKNGLVHWIVEQHTEADTLLRYDFAKLSDGLNVKHGSQISFLTGADTRNGRCIDLKQRITDVYGINIVYSNILYYFLMDMTLNYATHEEFMENHRKFIDKKTDDIFNLHVTPYRGVSYNRQPRSHRLLILSHMRSKQYLQKTLYSLGGKAERGIPSRWFNGNEYDYLMESASYFSTLPNTITPAEDETSIDLSQNQANTVCYNHALKSSLHIVTETVPNWSTFISEKSYKPFLYMQPFIQYGNIDNVKVLKEMGYETFDKWIDHSYDSEIDEGIRMRKFLKEMDRLYALSDADWSNMLYEMIDGLIHNTSLVTIPQHHCPMGNMTKILMDHMNGK